MDGLEMINFINIFCDISNSRPFDTYVPDNQNIMLVDCSKALDSSYYLRYSEEVTQQ